MSQKITFTYDYPNVDTVGKKEEPTGQFNLPDIEKTKKYFIYRISGGITGVLSQGMPALFPPAASGDFKQMKSDDNSQFEGYKKVMIPFLYLCAVRNYNFTRLMNYPKTKIIFTDRETKLDDDFDGKIDPLSYNRIIVISIGTTQYVNFGDYFVTLTVVDLNLNGKPGFVHEYKITSKYVKGIYGNYLGFLLKNSGATISDKIVNVPEKSNTEGITNVWVNVALFVDFYSRLACKILRVNQNDITDAITERVDAYKGEFKKYMAYIIFDAGLHPEILPIKVKEGSADIVYKTGSGTPSIAALNFAAKYLKSDQVNPFGSKWKPVDKKWMF